MRFSVLAVTASLLASSCGAAWAVSNGNEVSVNPVPAGGGGVLLYPGGQYMRVVRPLLAPGAKDGVAVQLHMPSHHTRVAVSDETAAVARKPKRAAAPSPAAAAPPAPRRVAAAAPPTPPPAPPPSSGYNPGFGAFGAPVGAAGLNLGEAPSAPAPAAPARKQQLAKAEPAPASTPSPESLGPGMTKRSVILFAAGAADPAQSALGAIKFLAGDLTASMTGPATRIQILAYGGDKGDKGSEARRLSLKRALAIRQVLIDDGVSSERIDVRAMGGADDSGPADRVDVYIKA